MATQMAPSSDNNAQSLWDQAFSSLSADLKTALGQAATHKRDILAAALEAAENRKATSLRKRWKFKRSNGEVVIIRDVLEKIAKWIDSFKAVGDAAVQFDASNASLPWAAVRLLLQVTVNDVQQYGTMVQDLEVVSRIIARYKEFENLHLGRDQSAEPALETALTVLYTEVLTHLAQTIAFFSQSTAGMFTKVLRKKILSREDEVLKLAKLQDTSDLRFIAKTVLRLKDQINNNTKRIEEEDSIKMISWLSTSPFSIHHETISEPRTPNFGQWLLQHEVYRNWCEYSSSSTLWIRGITGSGKTSLFSVIADSLLATRATNPESAPFAYFYCLQSESEPERSSADGILRSSLSDIMSRAENVVKVFITSRNSSDILSSLPTAKEIILQSGDTSRQLAIQTFSWLLYMKAPLTPEALLAAIATASIGNVPCTTADISVVCSNLVIIDLNRQIVRLAHHSVREYFIRTQQSLFSAPVAHSLLASICIKASSRGPPDNGSLEQQVKGFFFYAATHWASHFESSKVAKKEERLFQDMLSFVFEDEDYDVSLSFEAWLEIAKEIATLLPRDHPMKPALDAIPNETSSPIFLAAVFGIDGLLTLLSESESDIDWDQRNDLGHTALYVAVATGHLSTVTTLIEEGAELNIECGAYGSPLHVACFRGYEEIVEKLLQNGASPKCGSKFQSAVQAASHGGHEDIVLGLIRYDATIDSEDDYEQVIQMATEQGNPGQKQDAVAIAALYGHTDIVKYLLEQGLDIEAEGQFGTPLRSACLMNHKSTVEELLQRGANVNTEERKGNALYVAAVKGHADIVRILLEEGADLHQKTRPSGTALQAAAYYGHKLVVERLLDAGANVHAEGSSPDAFHAAAEGGHQEIIMLFLERESHPNTAEARGRSERSRRKGCLSSSTCSESLSRCRGKRAA
ncbi:Ankyrin repeat domain-containing protein 50 [Fusarium oxysporum f. sp. cubense race 1]|uniref:Ankyrin repeat domain-containing protein 50 n=1 Tax=Fusarium oxysporum f. sp. cubense (strain race 1) TaxID=1229664 RepID=N4UT21_FUSC1|nr:Ankyrin repeat domain-containing protein 50 [Fusarium oxysporum f. sp. cubense race 1]